jgi:hypothetical protein
MIRASFLGSGSRCGDGTKDSCEELPHAGTEAERGPRVVCGER